MPCFPLSENTYSVDDSKIFIPFDRERDSVADRPHSLIVDICPFLIITPNDKIVIDPGLGLKQSNGEYHIINNLRTHHLDAEDINIILLSHLHKDHFSGTVKSNSSEGRATFQPMFPNAKYYVQQGELEYALSKNSSSYEKEKIEFLFKNNSLLTMQGNGKLNEEVSYEISGGHTPYHQVFNISFNDEKYFYGGDVLPQPQQLQRKFMAKYDYDGKLSAELRIKYGKQIAQRHATALFFHSTSIPMAKVRNEGERFLIEPLPLIPKGG